MLRTFSGGSVSLEPTHMNSNFFFLSFPIIFLCKKNTYNQQVTTCYFKKEKVFK